MNVFERKAQGGEPVFLQDLDGEGVLRRVAQRVERAAGAGCHEGLREPRRKGIDGHEAPRRGWLVGRLEDGVYHLRTLRAAGDFAVKDIRFSLHKLVFDVGAVEEGEVEGAAVVHGARLDEVAPAADMVQARRRGHHRRDADGRAGNQSGDGGKTRAVLVGARVEADKVAQRHDTEAGECLRPRRADAAQGAHVRIQL